MDTKKAVERMTGAVYTQSMDQVIDARVRITLDEYTLVTRVTGYGTRSTPDHVTDYTLTLDRLVVELTDAEKPASMLEIAETEREIGDMILEMSFLETSPYEITCLEWTPHTLTNPWTAVCYAHILPVALSLTQSGSWQKETPDSAMRAYQNRLIRKKQVAVTFIR